MQVIVGSNIRIKEPTKEVVDWIKKELIISNPDYIKKARMGFWTGNTPKIIKLFSMDDKDYLIPFGCLKELSEAVGLTNEQVISDFRIPTYVEYEGKVPLYDYQEKAVNEMIKAHYGILQSAAGSGKTQMGIAIASHYHCKTLWLTHTKDLLNQSLKRAEQYYDKSLFGTITEGKVELGKWITFATVQTMANINLLELHDYFDCIIVDECHRVAGTPTKVTLFGKVLNNLSARHKFGLSATAHRSDGMIKSTYSYLGDIAYIVPDEAVKDKVMQVTVQPINTHITYGMECCNSDGTLNYQKMISYITGNEERNKAIVDVLNENKDHYNLILSSRLEHLEILKQLLGSDKSVLISGKMVSKTDKANREKYIEEMRTGNQHYLFATYQLAKEGLDIPRLDRLYLVTPQKDYAVIVQSVGRIARTFEGKDEPVCYDFIDNNLFSLKQYKKRCTSYRKAKCKIND